jgi:hypothetical protein
LAVRRALETVSDRLSKEFEDALNQMAQLIGRAQKQQYEIMSLFGKRAAAMEALADLVAKARNDDVERHNEHATAIEQLSRGQMKTAHFTDGLATQYGQLFKALLNRLDVVQKGGVRSELQPAAVDAASQLKGANIWNWNSSPQPSKALAFVAPWPRPLAAETSDSADRRKRTLWVPVPQHEPG